MSRKREPINVIRAFIVVVNRLCPWLGSAVKSSIHLTKRRHYEIISHLLLSANTFTANSNKMTNELNNHKGLHPHWEEGIPEPEVIHGPQHTREFKLRCRQFDTQYMDQVLHPRRQQQQQDALQDQAHGEKHLKWDGTVMEPEHDPQHDEEFRAHRKRFYNDKRMDQARKLLHAHDDTSSENEE